MNRFLMLVWNGFFCRICYCVMWMNLIVVVMRVRCVWVCWLMRLCVCVVRCWLSIMFCLRSCRVLRCMWLWWLICRCSWCNWWVSVLWWKWIMEILVIICVILRLLMCGWISCVLIWFVICVCWWSGIWWFCFISVF